ncbi:MAG: hypothetical protein ACI9RO_002496 [Alteromonas macleodii]|jgi:hypothetical protein|tara:strand:+ start:244 stop:375 length:132 start_codon:yes stop_codon:yes gene_type:complete
MSFDALSHSELIDALDSSKFRTTPITVNNNWSENKKNYFQTDR